MFSNIGTRHLLLVNVRSYDDDNDDDNNNNMYSDLFKVIAAPPRVCNVRILCDKS